MAHDIQAYLCELGVKPTEEVSIYSIEYYFDKLPVSTDELSVEKPKLSIPKKIAELLDEGDLMFLAWTHGNDLLGKVSDEERKEEKRLFVEIILLEPTTQARRSVLSLWR